MMQMVTKRVTTLVDNKIDKVLAAQMAQCENSVMQRVERELNKRIRKFEDEIFEDREKICSVETKINEICRIMSSLNKVSDLIPKSGRSGS